MMKWWLTAALVFANGCADDDSAGEGNDEGSDASEPDGGPCGIAGGPLSTDELHTPQIGTDALGRPSVVVELHEAGTCTGEPPAAAATVLLDPDIDSISIANSALEITAPAEYRDEHYWWDELGIDVKLEHAIDGVTITFHHGEQAPMVVCTPGDATVDCE